LKYLLHIEMIEHIHLLEISILYEIRAPLNIGRRLTIMSQCPAGSRRLAFRAFFSKIVRAYL